jgi:hypothetical protein
MAYLAGPSEVTRWVENADGIDFRRKSPKSGLVVIPPKLSLLLHDGGVKLDFQTDAFISLFCILLPILFSNTSQNN